jgi:hypothetical protein
LQPFIGQYEDKRRFAAVAPVSQISLGKHSLK